MKTKAAAVTIVLIAFAAVVSASGWKVVASYPAPAANARGISLGTIPFPNYCVLCDGSPPRIYNLFNPSQYINLNIPSGARDFAPRSGRLWVSHSNNFVYIVSTTGSLSSSFRCPKNGPAGVGPDGWVAIPAENLAIRLDTGGSIVASFGGPGSRLTGLYAYGSGYDYIVGDPDTHKLYFNEYGTGSLQSPIAIAADLTTNGPPWGHVYVVDQSTNWIFNFEWAGSGEPVTPSSFGRARGIFR